MPVAIRLSPVETEEPIAPLLSETASRDPQTSNIGGTHFSLFDQVTWTLEFARSAAKIAEYRMETGTTLSATSQGVGWAWCSTVSNSILSGESQNSILEYSFRVPNSTLFLSTAPSGNRLELEVLRANADGDWTTPTEYAYTRARSIIDDCSSAPMAFMTTDGEGGIRMVWRHGEKQVRLNIGGRPELKSYIYFESPDAHEIEHPQATNLLDRLRWLDA